MPSNRLHLGCVFVALQWSGNPPRRRAMTLVELMLVLVLLVVVGSLSAPLFEGSFSTIRLRRGSDHILSAWSQARTYAIETGNTYQFRFEPSGSSYRVEQWAGGIEVDSGLGIGDVEQAAAVTENATSGMEAELAEWTLEETLPEQIAFSSAERVETDELGQRETIRLDQQAAESWSAPILFFPDGTTSAASLLLKNNKRISQRITLRSLTGIGCVSELLTREEVDRLRNR